MSVCVFSLKELLVSNSCHLSICFLLKLGIYDHFNVSAKLELCYTPPPSFISRQVFTREKAERKYMYIHIHTYKTQRETDLVTYGNVGA